MEPELQPLIEMRGIRKEFPGVTALDDVDLDLFPGEVHVLLGENGAGKSTLMKVLAGVYEPDAGEVRLRGEPIRPRSVLEARALGLVMVLQEFNLIPDLTAAENIVLMNRPEGSLLGRVRPREMAAEARAILDRLGMRLQPELLVRQLTVAERQLVEIARAMSLSAAALILDEPTASLSDTEAERLFALIRDLVGRGLAVVYISHRFEEIFALGQRVTVLRDGKRVASSRLESVSRERLLRDMAGRELSELYPRQRSAPGPAALSVSGLSTTGNVSGASFELRQGEILGLAGLVGAGRTELAKAVFGATAVTAGEVRVAGRPVRIHSPRHALALGLVYCTEDRKEEGLFLDQDVAFNISVSSLKEILKGGLVSLARESALARGYIERLRIVPADERRQARTLSGGGQQKVVLARGLCTRPSVLILDEPTRGIDVSAKVEIYRLMDRFVAEGGAILLVSSDLPELTAMSDRILVLHEGRITGELAGPEFRPEAILALATGMG